MSYTFSRRAFLKYSAVTAVAVVGAGLLNGCEYQDPKNPVCKTLPGALTSDLQVRAGLRSMKIEGDVCTLEVDIESARANPIPLDPYRFSVAVKAEGYLAYQNDKLQVIYPDSLSHQVKQGETFTYYVKAKGLNPWENGPVTLTYYPDLQYSEFSANWELSADVLAPEGPGTSTT